MIGFGFGTRRSKKGGVSSPAIATIVPSAAWTGTAGSGFASAPSDPQRTTAKPAMQLMVPPNQFFTDQLIVGVMAMANDAGSLMNALGLEKVVVHCEGASHDITQPSLRTFDDANGRPVTYLGWWITLTHPGQNGEAQVYFEAVPRDPAMQARVIGPYSFFPESQLHDYEIEVSASQPVLTGQRYQTIQDAVSWVRSQSPRNPLITITEGGIYDWRAIGGGYEGDGYLTVTATQPVSIIATQLGYLRIQYDGVRFRGDNITFDASQLSQVYHENPSQRQHWFDGCRFVDARPRVTLENGNVKYFLSMSRDSAYFTEVYAEGINDAANGASLVRGCTFKRGFRDVFTGARLAIGNTIEDWTSGEFRTPVDALSVSYSGSAATATLEISGLNNTANRIVTMKTDGAVVGTFTIDRNDPSSGFYWVSDLVAYINTLSEWQATLLDDSRRAAVLNGNALAPSDVKSGPLTITGWFDHHADLWQSISNPTENVIIWGNAGFRLGLQNLAIGAHPYRDFFFINNALHSSETDYDFGLLINQLGGVQSHVVAAHNSFPNQAVTLRTDMTGVQEYDPDTYCLMAANVFQAMAWGDEADGDLLLSSNHLHAGSSDPAGAVATTLGGDASDLFADPGEGDFTPQGALLSSRVEPFVLHDLNGAKRGANSTKGAVR